MNMLSYMEKGYYTYESVKGLVRRVLSRCDHKLSPCTTTIEPVL